LARDVHAAEEELLVALILFSGAVCRILPAPLGVEAAETLLERVELLVIHVVIQEDLLLLQLAHDLYPGALGERHVEKAVEGLAILGAHLQGCRDEVCRAGVAHAEEIPEGYEHARLFLSIPVHPEQQPAQEVRLDSVRGPVHVLVGGGDPDVIYGAGAAHFGQRHGRAGLHVQPVVVATGAVPA
jgi:hypothetical protein